MKNGGALPENRSESPSSPPEHPVVRAVLFDFDGTLTKPHTIDFTGIKKDLGCPGDQPILEFLDTLSEEDTRQAMVILDRHEVDAAERSEPNSDAEDLIEFLRRREVPIGILSRNSMQSILRALKNFRSTTPEHFDLILSRDEAKPKPNPDGVLLTAESFEVDVKSLLVVGDYVFDVEAARRAGAPAVLLTNGTPPPPPGWPSDYTVDTLAAVKEVIDSLLPLSTGKLPNRFLDRFLSEQPTNDPSVLVAPGMGEDTAAVALDASDDVLVLKTDPITFTSDQLGLTTVVVNSNDIATAGATPRWLLTTLLFPLESNAAQIGQLMKELGESCERFGITLCGGHTEITESVTQPVAIGQMIGTVRRDRLIDKKNMAVGDHVLLTKSIALEGTSILARDFGSELIRMGVSAQAIERGGELLFDPGISVLTEARVAAQVAGVSAMHDVTEGGLATALVEFSSAGGHALEIDVDAITVLPECRAICQRLNIDPLGLIGSGSLLIACRPESTDDLLDALKAGGVDAVRIGVVVDGEPRINAQRDGQSVDWLQFEVDELGTAITRLEGWVDSE